MLRMLHVTHVACYTESIYTYACDIFISKKYVYLYVYDVQLHVHITYPIYKYDKQIMTIEYNMINA